jgi:hypothetical protein
LLVMILHQREFEVLDDMLHRYNTCSTTCIITGIYILNLKIFRYAKNIKKTS